MMFSKLKGFNENLFWMEDIDLCTRINQAGFSVFYFPKTKIIHFVGKSASKNFKVSVSNQLKSKIKYFGIHHSKIERFLILITVLIVCLIKSLMLSFLCPFSSIYRKKFFAYTYTMITIFHD